MVASTALFATALALVAITSILSILRLISAMFKSLLNYSTNLFFSASIIFSFFSILLAHYYYFFSSLLRRFVVKKKSMDISRIIRDPWGSNSYTPTPWKSHNKVSIFTIVSDPWVSSLSWCRHHCYWSCFRIKDELSHGLLSLLDGF